MKVLIVNTFYYPNMQGGAEQSVKLLAENLVKKGHTVAVFTIDSKDSKDHVEEHNGVKIFRNTAGDFNLWRFSYDKKSVGTLEKATQKLICYCNKGVLKRFDEVCDEFEPQVVHTNTTYGISAMVWKHAFKKKIPVVHTIRDTAIISPVQYGHSVNRIILKMHQLYMKKASGYVTAVTAPSDYTLSTSLEIGSFRNAKIKKCVVNSVQINYERFEEELREKEARTSELIKFMYAGRLIYFKGIEHMIQAFESLDDKNIELHICGGGEMTDFVTDHAKKDERIIYHGKLNNEQLMKMYSECDVLLIPSCWPEPFGRVVIEGNLHAMPVIAGNWGGIPEIIGCMKGGVLYAAPSAEELAEHIERFKDRRYIASFLPEIKKNMPIYGIENQINEFEGIYRSIISDQVMK